MLNSLPIENQENIYTAITSWRRSILDSHNADVEQPQRNKIKYSNTKHKNQSRLIGLSGKSALESADRLTSVTSNFD